MDRVQGQQAWLGERAGGEEESAVEWEQCDRIQGLAGAGDQQFERDVRVLFGGASDRAR